MCEIFTKHGVLLADDSVCNESQKSSSNTHRATNVNQPTQPKIPEKAHPSNALNGSNQKNAHGMFSFITIYFGLIMCHCGFVFVYIPLAFLLVYSLENNFLVVLFSTEQPFSFNVC